jgi:hypothetical protein
MRKASSVGAKSEHEIVRNAVKDPKRGALLRQAQRVRMCSGGFRKAPRVKWGAPETITTIYIGDYFE